MEAFELFRSFGPGFWRVTWKLVKFSARGWAEPVNRLRARLGLPKRANPLMDDLFSPRGTQAWFSKALAQPQPDWPSNVKLKPGLAINDAALSRLIETAYGDIKARVENS